MLKPFIARYWPVLAATAVLFPHALLFDFVNDDAYISFRYARNLAEHGQLVFNLGERVEGYTNFLWTVMLAGGVALGISPVILSRFLGVAFAIGTLALTVRIGLRLDNERPAPAQAIAPVGLAAMGAFACWCTGGLETQLFTFLSLLGFHLLLTEVSTGRGWWSGICFALAAMTRPEGIFFFALASLFRVARNWRVERRLAPLRHEIAFVVAFLAVFIPYYVWRWSYFGYAFPNTFYVKSSGGAGTWTRGLYYLRRFAEDYAVGFSLLLVVLGWPPAIDRRRRDLFTLTALVVVAFAAYVIKVGGDFMGLYRFILPVIPLSAICVQEAVRVLYRRLEPHVPRLVLTLSGAAVATAFVAGSVKVTLTAREVGDDNGIDSPGYLKKYADDRVPIGLWFAQHARPEHLATVGGAGVIPYYSGMRAFDAYGLVDSTIAHDPTMSSGSSRPGHQKWPADWYLWQRKPTVITHRYFLREKRTEADDFWRRNGYEWVTATIPGLSPPPFYSFLKRRDQAFGPFPAK